MNTVYNIPTNVRINEDLKFRVDSVAKANGISISDVVRITLITGLPDFEKNGVTLNSTKAKRK